MTLPTTPWEPRWTCAEVDTASPAATGIAALAATELLWLASGQQFARSVLLRPCKRSCLPAGYEYSPVPVSSWGYPYPALVGGTWINLGCGGCGGDCHCGTLQEAELPGTVTSITAVKVDGVVVSGSAYRLDRSTHAAGTLLVRLDGGTWPTCQDLTKADTEPGTWSVTAVYGQPVPELGRLAVGELACEFLKGFTGADCRIPNEVVSLARQGVTLNFPDPTSVVVSGFFGAKFIEAVNPDKRRKRARVVSPDRHAPRRVGV